MSVEDIDVFIYRNLKEQLRDKLISGLSIEFPDIPVASFVSNVIDNEIDFTELLLDLPDPDIDDTPETLKEFLIEYINNIDLSFLTHIKDKVILHNEVSMREYGIENFNNIYDRCFKNILTHPDIVLSNKYKHKGSWRNKIVKDDSVINDGKPDYTLILFKRVIELEAQLSVIKSLHAEEIKVALARPAPLRGRPAHQ